MKNKNDIGSKTASHFSKDIEKLEKTLTETFENLNRRTIKRNGFIDIRHKVRNKIQEFELTNRPAIKKVKKKVSAKKPAEVTVAAPLRAKKPAAVVPKPPSVHNRNFKEISKIKGAIPKIFIGGFGGTGSRVITKVLNKIGYYIPYFVSPETVDYRGFYFVRLFDKYMATGEINKVKELLFDDFKDLDSFVVKHGHFLFIQDKLKEWFPDSKYLHIYRNPVDQSTNNNYTWHNKYGGLPRRCPIPQKAKYVYETDTAFMSTADYIVKLEDLIINKEKTIKDLISWTGVDYEYKEIDFSFIINPGTFGRGSRYYDEFEKLIRT